MDQPKIASETELIEIQDSTFPKGKVEKKGGKRVGYNYIIIKSYKQSQKNDVVKCLYIKSLVKFGFCVIKEGSQGDTKDKEGRDIIDRLKWQTHLHKELQGKIKIPRLVGTFEENGNYYLVIEHIRGKALQKLCWDKRHALRQSIQDGGKIGRQFLNYLIQIASLLESLHEQGIVHRDATPNNYMVTAGGKVALIDMEMCYSLNTQYPTPPFQLGTYGYMSPQQEATQTPTPAEDIFALGAIILQIWSSVQPSKLIKENPERLKQKISFFISDTQIAEIVSSCLLPNDSERPTAKKVKETLLQYRSDIKAKRNRASSIAPGFSQADIKETIQDTINTLNSPLLTDSENGWFADDMRPPAEADKHKIRKVWYASYDRGVSGIMYFLASAKSVGFDTSQNVTNIEKGFGLIHEKYIAKIHRKRGGLHFGADGIAAALAQIMKSKLVETTDELLEMVYQLLEKSTDSWSIMRGLAGQGIANFHSQEFIPKDLLLDRLARFATELISNQQKNGQWVYNTRKKGLFRQENKLSDISFGEGMAGIIYFLLQYGYVYQHGPSIISATKGLKWIIRKAKFTRNTVYWASSTNKKLSYGWLDGSGGIALTFLRAYQFTNDSLYKDFALKILTRIDRNLIDGNVGLRYGLSGLGQVYLEAYNVLKEKEWYDRAGYIVQVIMRLKKTHPKYGTYWLVENERTPTANIMTGNSGVLHFLLRHCHPHSIPMPMI